jgi:hypothetical protein
MKRGPKQPDLSAHFEAKKETTIQVRMDAQTLDLLIRALIRLYAEQHGITVK